MSPSSFAYMGFLLAGVLLYHAVPQRGRKIVLLALSVLFYGINALRFVPLLLATIVFNFALAQRLERAKRRRALLILGLTVDLGALGLFKYLGFFGELVNLAGGAFGLPAVTVWQLALPIGISFYTFVLCGYLIDVYRGRPAERNPLDFALFASFFPAILSGPIERSDHLLPQLRRLRRAAHGLRGDAAVQAPPGAGLPDAHRRAGRAGAARPGHGRPLALPQQGRLSRRRTCGRAAHRLLCAAQP